MNLAERMILRRALTDTLEALQKVSKNMSLTTGERMIIRDAIKSAEHSLGIRESTRKWKSV